MPDLEPQPDSHEIVPPIVDAQTAQTEEAHGQIHEQQPVAEGYSAEHDQAASELAEMADEISARSQTTGISAPGQEHEIRTVADLNSILSSAEKIVHEIAAIPPENLKGNALSAGQDNLIAAISAARELREQQKDKPN
ncbi:MAG: hypothetical protein A2751_04455 [Candidatus Doudnabacteria bacterium RIFCSPHIGHO2_01_FULL_46_14]|uniref:Uncharacterized protein n=1 Tax=Candidatus Doudnabacteria bacterium RIFCSPHIGHO2_01_FULL_46_14 TaxID=1817824 RepID=A0A1F5NNF2_9BACT|nr:MAG: hypothetical protein A2751_04455 [Candidatus Doudnabacteria bacterium RIFCSPHIGHO2_01_FULL_46_14]